MSISQLDLLLLGGRGLTARLSGLESSVRGLTFGSVGLGDGGSSIQTVRPNLLSNNSFEYYHRGSTVAQDWVFSVGASLFTAAVDTDGSTVVRLNANASVSQVVAQGANISRGAFVLSVAARTQTVGQVIALEASHTPGITWGPIFRLDLSGEMVQSDVVPADGQWHRFFRQAIIGGGAQVSITIRNDGTDQLDIDAAKFEHEPGATSFVLPTAYQGSDWGGAAVVRNFRADNIIAGTLTVGGSSSEAPHISVLDDGDTEIVVIGDRGGSTYGVEVKGTAGIKVTGSGSVEVLGGGSVKVKGGGDITLDGGDINVTNGQVAVSGTGGINVSGGGSVNVQSGGDVNLSGGNVNVQNGGSVIVSGTGVIRAGTTGAQRVDIGAGGLRAYNSSNQEQIRIDAADGKLKVLSDGGLQVTGSGGIDVSGGGSVKVTGTGKVVAGVAAGARTELDKDGLRVYNPSNSEQLRILTSDGTMRVLGQGSIQVEGGGSILAGSLSGARAELTSEGLKIYNELNILQTKLSAVSGDTEFYADGTKLVYTDGEGFWMVDNTGQAVFGISGIDHRAWGGIWLDKGDVMMGREGQDYLLFDNSTGRMSLGAGAITLDSNGLTIEPIDYDDWEYTENDRAVQWKKDYLRAMLVTWYDDINNEDTLFIWTPGGTIDDGRPNTLGSAIHIEARGSPIPNGNNSAVLIMRGASSASGGKATARLHADDDVYISTLRGFVHVDSLKLGDGVGSAPYTTLDHNAVDNYLSVSGNLRVHDSGNVNTSGRAMIGHHSSYSGHAAFWRDGTSTALALSSSNIVHNVQSASGTYYWRANGSDRMTLDGNGWLRVGGRIYVGLASSYFYSDDNVRTAHQGNLAVLGDIYCSAGGQWLSTTINSVNTLNGRVNQAVNTTSNPVFNSLLLTNGFSGATNRPGQLIAGNIGYNWTPSNSDWTTTSTLILHGLDTTSISFHDSGNRVDSIVAGFGIISIGYNGGWGAAGVSMPGRVGIGMGNHAVPSTTTLNVRAVDGGTNTAFQVQNAAPSNLIYCRNDGYLWANRAWDTSSDARLKEDVVDLGYGLAEVLQLRPVSFRYKSISDVPNERIDFGYIAQEVLEVTPELVSENSEGYLSMNYQGVEAMHTRAIQELHSLVEALRAEVAELRSQLG